MLNLKCLFTDGCAECNSLEFIEDQVAIQIWETSAYWIRSQNEKSKFKRVEVQRVVNCLEDKEMRENQMKKPRSSPQQRRRENRV